VNLEGCKRNPIWGNIPTFYSRNYERPRNISVRKSEFRVRKRKGTLPKQAILTITCISQYYSLTKNNMGVLYRETIMKERKEYTFKFVRRNSACQRRQNVDITWMIVDQYTGQRDGSPLCIGEETLISPVFQTWKCAISGPIDTDIFSLRSRRASSLTNPTRLKLLRLMTMLTMNGTWLVLDRILCYFRSSFHLTIGFFLSCFTHLFLSTATLLFWFIIQMGIKELPDNVVYTNIFESVSCFFWNKLDINIREESKCCLKWKKVSPVLIFARTSFVINLYGFSLLHTTLFNQMQYVQ
jgi:hypothetical protein